MEFELKRACRAVFDGLEYEAFGGCIHLESGKGPVLSGWASAHHALALRHLDTAQANIELRTLYEACQLPNGLLSRERRLPSEDEPPEDEGRSLFIDPPVAAYAVAQLALDGQLEDEALLERATQHVDAIWGERLPPDTSLPVILHPAESGVPTSPLFADVIESAPGPEWHVEAGNLARSALGCQLDPARALRAGHPFVIEDPVFCGWLLIALEHLERAWELQGNNPHVLKLRVRSSMIRDAIEERLWWPAEELYVGFDRARSEPLRAITCGGLVPAGSTHLLEEGNAKRAIDRYLRPTGSVLWGAQGLCLVPVPPGRAPELLRAGEGVSPLAHYWGHRALMGAGRSSDARVARAQLEALLESQGFFGLYDLISGLGREEHGASLGTLALEMRAAEG